MTISDPDLHLPHPWRVYPQVPVLVSEHKQLLASMNEHRQVPVSINEHKPVKMSAGEHEQAHILIPMLHADESCDGSLCADHQRRYGHSHCYLA